VCVCVSPRGPGSPYTHRISLQLYAVRSQVVEREVTYNEKHKFPQSFC